MITIFKKTGKTIDNQTGIKIIENVNELNKPILLCLSPQDNLDNAVYGIVKMGMQAARVNTTEEMAAGFIPELMPVDFIGLKFEKDDKYDSNYEEIADKLIYPIIVEDGKISKDKMIKNARKVNIFAFCDGTLTYKNIEKYLKEKLNYLKLDSETIMKIVNQIAVVSLATIVQTENFNATTVTFIDINDNEILTERIKSYRLLLEKKQQKSLYGTAKNNTSTLFISQGEGKHALKSYLKNDQILKPSISSIVSMVLENSIANNQSDELIPITKEEIQKNLKKYSDDTKPVLDLLKELDDSISYNGAPKFTKEEANRIIYIEKLFKENKELKDKLAELEKRDNDKDKRISSLVGKIKKYCSDITFYQILISSGLWQSTVKDDVFKEKTDRQIRSEYTRILENKNLK